MKNEEVRTREVDRLRRDAAEQTSVIASLMKEIAKLQTTSAKLLIKITDLQLVGELALFLVITPYYVSQMLLHFVSPFARHFDPEWLRFITTGIAFDFGCLGLEIEHHRRRTNWRKRKADAERPAASADAQNVSAKK